MPNPLDSDVRQKLHRLIEVMKEVSTDAEADAMSIDGTPFTGAEIGPRLGETYAMVKALAEGLNFLADVVLHLAATMEMNDG